MSAYVRIPLGRRLAGASDLRKLAYQQVKSLPDAGSRELRQCTYPQVKSTRETWTR